MEKKLTYKKKVELAEWIAENNGGAITGSLMLKRRGIDLGREPNDIDIVIEETMNTNNIILPPFVEKKEGDIGADGYLVLARVWIAGTKIEFLQDDESLKKSERNLNMFPTHGCVRYCLIEDLVAAKKRYIEEDENAEYIEKNIRDLEIIEKFQSKFPIIRYEVLYNGHLSKLVSNGIIDDCYKFDEFDLMDGVSMFDDWKYNEDKEPLFLGHRNIIKAKIEETYESLDDAIAVSKERWYKEVNPNSKYVVRQLFDDMFEKNVSNPLSKREAHEKAKELNKKASYLQYFDIMPIDEKQML